MTEGERIREDRHTSGPNPEAKAVRRPQTSSGSGIDVPPMIRKAIEKHRGDLPELMKRYSYQWAAYHGEDRLEIGKSKRTLYHKYLDLNMSRDELVVLGIGPEIPDVIDGEELLDR